MFKKNKRAIEISINFIVVLVMALFIFGLSVWFLRDVFSGVEDIYTKTADELDAKIGFISCGDAPACLNTNELEIRRAEYKVFGMRVYNYKPDKVITVRITVKGDTYISVANPEDKLVVILGMDKTYRDFTLEPGEEGKAGILVKAHDDAPSGKYLLNVWTKYCEGDTFSCSQPENFGEGLYKLYVIVP